MINVDRLKLFPQQTPSHQPTECCGITRALILSNVFGIPMDYGFNYASDLYLQRLTPTTAGENPLSGMQADCVYGALPASQEPSNAGNEQLEMNWADYSPNEVSRATNYLMKGFKYIETYDDIMPYIQSTGWGVMLCYNFYASFLSPNADGTLPDASGASTTHCSPVWGNTPQGLILNPLLGPNLGDGGYVYMSQTQFESCSLSLIAYDPNATAFVTRAFIGLEYPRAIGDVLKVIKR